VNPPDWLTDTKTSYDTVAASYAEMFHDGLSQHPYVRGALALFAELLRDVDGPVLDVGCGIGLLTGPLRDLGLQVFGMDLSPGCWRSPAVTTPTCGSRSAP
jgi:2-polyprenyl-3-methyl-5-hydroxy-6-metoxy-1,4-benzoquinol methylase